VKVYRIANRNKAIENCISTISFRTCCRNTYNFHLFISVISNLSTVGVLKRLRMYRAVTYFNAVDALGSDAFWKLKQSQGKIICVDPAYSGFFTQEIWKCCVQYAEVIYHSIVEPVLFASGVNLMIADSVTDVAGSHKASLGSDLLSLIESEEGRRDAIYLDTKGTPTGGVGHAFHVGSKLPNSVWEAIFIYDVALAQEGFKTLSLAHMDERRRHVCIAMIFQLGLEGFKGFKKTIKFLERRKYREAAIEMLDSKWAEKDTPARAKRMASIMFLG